MMWLALAALYGCAPDPVERIRIPDPGARRRVWAFTSDDGQTWTRQPEPVAWHLESLGLATDPDTGDLLVTGVIDELGAPWWEWYLGPPIRGLRFDGTTWQTLRIEGADPEALSYIDPQLFEGAAWYIAPPSSDGDPALRTEDTPLRSAPPPQTRYAAPAIADPSPVRLDGTLHVFVTHNFNILHLKGEPLRPHGSILGANVPFPVVWPDGSLRLLAQTARSRTREPVLAVYDPHTERSLTEPLTLDWQPVLGAAMDGLDSCTSPVMGHSPAGGWLLLCVEEVADCSAPGAAEQLSHCRELTALSAEEQADCAEPGAAEQYAHCRSGGQEPAPPPPPGTRAPPEPVDCDYPDAAEKDPRCRPQVDCAAPDAAERYPSCRRQEATPGGQPIGPADPTAARRVVEPPPPPGTAMPPEPVDCDYPDAAEKDPRCRTQRVDCALPGASEKYVHCREASAP